MAWHGDGQRGSHKHTELKWLLWAMLAACAPVAVALLAVALSRHDYLIVVVCCAGLAFIIVGIHSDRLRQHKDPPDLGQHPRRKEF